MNIQVNETSATRKSLVVTLEPPEIDAQRQAVLADFVRMASLPGFRPGKAPEAMVRKKYGKEIEAEVRQKVLTHAYQNALKDSKLEVLNVVKVDDPVLKPGEPATLTITVDVRPQFELPDYTGLETEVQPTDVTDAEVDAVVEGLRAERADFKPATRAARKGDYVKLSYEGSIDGRPIAEIAPEAQIYGKVPQTWEEVEGANEGVIPGLGAQLGGLSIGDRKNVEVTFPENFSASAPLAGKKAAYAVEVQEIRERVLPELNEEFLKGIQVDSVEALRAQVQANLKARKEAANAAARRRQVTEALAARADFAVPQSLVDAETQGVLRQFLEENMRRGVPAEQFEKDKKSLFEGARQAATARVKLQFILARIAEQEKLKIENADLDRYIHREAGQSGQRPEKIAKDLSKDQDRLRSLQQQIIFDKAVDFLVSKASVKTVSQPPAETAKPN